MAVRLTIASEEFGIIIFGITVVTLEAKATATVILVPAALKEVMVVGTTKSLSPGGRKANASLMT